MEGELRPRVCYLSKGDRDYGFHLHGRRNKGGQFVRKVEPGSPADLSGLRPGDRLVEVNGENVERETHHEVVDRIRAVGHRTRLLVVDRDTDAYLSSRGLPCTEDLAVEMGTFSPRRSPRLTPSASPTLGWNGAASPNPTRTRPADPASPNPTRTRPADPPASDSDREAKRSSVTSSTETDSELPVEPSPEVELLVRLCHLVKGERGYGFNLQSNKPGQGQIIRSVDPGSTAESAGVRPGDRLVEVDGVNIEGLRHSEVVRLIREGGEETRLLVVDQETDELFQRLGVTPSSSHVKEVHPVTESTPPAPSPPADSPLPAADPPVINVTLTDSPIANGPPKPRADSSSVSQSSRSSTSQSEFSSSDMSIQVPDEDERHVPDPFLESGLRLSPTAAEAKKKALANREKKSAPPMDWSKKHEIFSNF